MPESGHLGLVTVPQPIPALEGTQTKTEIEQDFSPGIQNLGILIILIHHHHHYHHYCYANMRATGITGCINGTLYSEEGEWRILFPSF